MPNNSDFENGSASASSGASLSKNEIRNTAASDAKIAQGSLDKFNLSFPSLEFFSRHFLLASMGFTSVLLLAMLANSSQSSQIVALRDPPTVTCIGRTCTAASSSATKKTTAVSPAKTASSAATAKKPGIFQRFHAAPANYHAAPTMQRADNVQGVYLTSASVKRTEFFDETVKSLKEAGGTALVFDIKGGYVFFEADMPKAKELNLVLPLYELPVVLEKLRSEGIYSIGRFVAVKDHELTKRLPETRQKHPKTGVTLVEDWIDPSNEKALEVNREYICAAARAGIDEINLDYIRMTTAAVGALRVFSGQEKADRVEKFVTMAREAIDECGNGSTRLGLSTYAILGWAYDINVATLGQDVVRFAPLVDIISPMAYPATFTSPEYYIPGKSKGSRDYWLVYRTLTGYAELLGPEHQDKIRPWIQGYYVSAQDVRDQISAVYDAGFCGFQVWNANNNYGNTYAGMKSGPEKPERCK